MKKLLLIIIVFVCSSALANGQGYYKKRWEQKRNSGISVSATTLRSVRGWQSGPELGYTTASRVHIGLFSYSGTRNTERPAQKYQGLQLAFPLLTIGDWSLRSNNRLGLHDQRFVSFLPTLSANYRLSQQINLSAGMGVSDRLPVFDFKLSFHLNNFLK